MVRDHHQGDESREGVDPSSFEGDEEGVTPMRKVTLGVANSLDTFIARPDHTFDWILGGPEPTAAMATYWETIDTVLMGSKTYEVAVHSGQGGGSPGMTTYVFSRTLASGDHGDVSIVGQDAAEFVGDLKAQEGRDICLMGGGELARSLFEADLIDEIRLNIHPLLLGSGVPLFPEMSCQIDLELVECKTFANGCVCVTYRIRPQPSVM